MKSTVNNVLRALYLSAVEEKEQEDTEGWGRHGEDTKRGDMGDDDSKQSDDPDSNNNNINNRREDRVQHLRLGGKGQSLQQLQSVAALAAGEVLVKDAVIAARHFVF